MKKRNLLQKLNNGFHILKKSILHFGENRPIELAGTTAYFATFSMVPILIIIISIFGYFAGEETIRDKLFNELNVLIGHEGSSLLQKAIVNYEITKNSRLGTIIGIGFFLFSATTLFSTMQNSINYIWRIKVKDSLKMNVLKFIKDRILSFGLILSLGFVLLVSLIIDSSITFLRDLLTTYLSPDMIIMVQIINICLSLSIISFVFAVIFRFLPDVKVRWTASWFGAIFTSVMFSLGKFLIGMFVGGSRLGVVYGAGSSLVIILMWIYYASLIFYFGVELSYQFSKYYRHNNKPVNYAVPFEINSPEKKKTRKNTD